MWITCGRDVYKIGPCGKNRFLCAISTKEVLKFYTTDMKGFSDFRNYGKTEKSRQFSVQYEECLLLLYSIRKKPSVADQIFLYRSHTVRAVGGCRDDLTELLRADIACGEHARHARHTVFAGFDVASLIGFYGACDQCGDRNDADGNNTPSTVIIPASPAFLFVTFTPDTISFPSMESTTVSHTISTFGSASSASWRTPAAAVHRGGGSRKPFCTFWQGKSHPPRRHRRRR